MLTIVLLLILWAIIGTIVAPFSMADFEKLSLGKKILKLIYLGPVIWFLAIADLIARKV